MYDLTRARIRTADLKRLLTSVGGERGEQAVIFSRNAFVKPQPTGLKVGTHRSRPASGACTFRIRKLRRSFSLSFSFLPPTLVQADAGSRLSRVATRDRVNPEKK